MADFTFHFTMADAVVIRKGDYDPTIHKLPIVYTDLEAGEWALVSCLAFMPLVIPMARVRAGAIFLDNRYLFCTVLETVAANAEVLVMPTELGKGHELPVVTNETQIIVFKK